jgi:hypothetical protein
LVKEIFLENVKYHDFCFMMEFMNNQQLRKSGTDRANKIQGDSLARGPKLLSIKNYVSQLTDDELTAGYCQQDGAICHPSNASKRQIERFFQDRIISKNL